MNTLVYYFKALRPRHWLKNVFCLLPVIFVALGHKASEQLARSAVVFSAFCLFASAVYLFNDVWDLAADRRNPLKRTRPLAAGHITVRSSYVLALALIVCALLMVWMTLPLAAAAALSACLCVYLLANIAYSLRLKHLPVVDIVILASGYLLRMYAGSLVTGITVSAWLFLVVFSIALFMGVGKRWGGALAKDATGAAAPETLPAYPPDFLRSCVLLFATLVIVFYSLWAVVEVELQQKSSLYIFSVPLVLLVVIVYLFDLHAGKYAGDPTELIFHNRWLRFLLAAYCVLLVFMFR